MNIKINENQELCIKVWDIIANLSEIDLLEFLDSASCSDTIIKNVSDQLIDGWTELGSYGSKSYGVDEPSTPLEKAIRRIAKGANDVAKKEIESLERALIRRKDNNRKTNKWAWRMFHAWPNGYWRSRPVKEYR